MELVNPRDLWHNTVSKLLKLEILQWELGKSFYLSAFFLPSYKYTYRNTHTHIYMFLLHQTNVHNIWKFVWVGFFAFFYYFLFICFIFYNFKKIPADVADV